MNPSSQEIVNDAHKKIEDVIRVNVLGPTGDDKARGQAWYEAVQELREQLRIIHQVAATAEKIPLMAVACDIELASLERGTWPKWRAILTGDVTPQPNHPWLLVGTQQTLQASSAPDQSSHLPVVAPQPSGSSDSPEGAPATSSPEQDVEMEDAVARPTIPAVEEQSRRTKAAGKRKEQVQQPEEEDELDEEEPVERGRKRERGSTSKDPKLGRSRAKSKAPSATADDTSPPPEGPCVACARRKGPCTPLAGRACRQCNSRKVRCSLLLKSSRSVSRPRPSTPLATPAPPEPTNVPAKTGSKQPKATAPQKPPASKRGRSQSRPRRQTSPTEASPPPTRAKGPSGIVLKITPAPKRAREASAEETAHPRKAQKFDGVWIPKSTHTKEPTAPSTLDGLMKAYRDLKTENDAMRKRMETMEDSLLTLGNVVEGLRERDGTSAPRGSHVGHSPVNPVGASLPSSSNIPASALGRSPTPPSANSTQRPAALPVSTSPVISPPQSTTPISPVAAQDSVPHIAASPPEASGSTEEDPTTTGPSGADMAMIASVAVYQALGRPPPLFPLK